MQKEEQVEPLESKLINFASFHHSKTNVALFTDEEIASQPCQLERERRRFWNSKLKQLSLSKEVDHYNKTEIVGIVDTAWTFKKAQLLQIMASELRVMQERIQTVYAERYPTIIGKTCTDPLLLSSSINKNLESVAKLTFFCQTENEKLLEIKCKTNSYSAPTRAMKDKLETEERLHNYLSDLKRASDSLFKALAVQEKRLKNIETELKFCENCRPVGGEFLTLEEEIDIVVGMQQEN